MLRHVLSRAIWLAFLTVPVLLAAGCKEAEKKGVDATKMTVGNPNAGCCPVSGNRVDVAKALADPALHTVYEGKVYVFCCPACKPEFDKDPKKCLASPAAPKPVAPAEQK